MLISRCFCGTDESLPSESVPSVPSVSESAPSLPSESIPSLSWDGHTECGYCRAVPEGYQIDMTADQGSTCLCELLDSDSWVTNGPFTMTGTDGAIDACVWYTDTKAKSFYQDTEGGPVVCHEHASAPLWTVETYPFAEFQVFAVYLHWYEFGVGGSGLGIHRYARYTTAFPLESSGSPPSVNCMVTGALSLDTSTGMWPSTDDPPTCDLPEGIALTPI